MRTEELQYELPPERIAQTPAPNRLDARLLVLDRRTGHLEHATFRQLGRWLRHGDLLVLNDTRVLPARFDVQRTTGGKVEGLFLREVCSGQWDALLKGGGRLRNGECLRFQKAGRTLTLMESLGRGQYRVRIEPADSAEVVLEQEGRTPLPPYIRRPSSEGAGDDRIDRQRYQTEYARVPGAVAAPTAGLHFTREFLTELTAAGIEIATLTLQVGLGTFQPITVDRLEDHQMHSEEFAIDEACIAALERTRRSGGRIVAVGTTTTRALESAADESGRVRACTGQTDLLIYPPYRFRSIDAMVTNFHLPGSTLLAMVFAFASREQILDAYQTAIGNDYRFYSYGDAMLIL